MSLFLAEIAGRIERERLEKLANGLIPGRYYQVYPYRRGEELKQPIGRGMFIGREGQTLMFDSMDIKIYLGYNSIVDALAGIPALNLDVAGTYTGISDIAPLDGLKVMERFDVKIHENCGKGLKLEDLEKKLFNYHEKKKAQDPVTVNGTTNYVLRNGLIVNLYQRTGSNPLNMLVSGNSEIFDKSIGFLRRIYSGSIEVTYI